MEEKENKTVNEIIIQLSWDTKLRYENLMSSFENVHTSFLYFLCYLKLNRYLDSNFNYLHKHGGLLL